MVRSGLVAVSLTSLKLELGKAISLSFPGKRSKPSYIGAASMMLTEDYVGNTLVNARPDEINSSLYSKPDRGGVNG